MKTLRFISMVSVLALAVLNLSAQYEPPAQKVKTMVVYEEKFNTLISKKMKDSEITYDKNGNITESIIYTDGKVTEHFRYAYDAAGNKIKEEELDANGKVIETSEYKIENGLRTEKLVYDANRKMISRKTYTYTLH